MSETIYVEGSGAECDATLNTWMKDLLPRTPGAVRAVVQRELVLAAREFYERSLAWRVVIGPKNIVANRAKYPLSPYDAYANVVRVLQVEFNESPLHRLARRPAGETETADSPSYYYLIQPDTLQLWPTPTVSADGALTVWAALTPKPSVTHLPNISVTHHYDALLDGVLGRLLAHPAKPYSNVELGKYHLNRFRNAIGTYKAEAASGYTGGQVWRYPRFGS